MMMMMMAGSSHMNIREGQMGCTPAGDCRGLCVMHRSYCIAVKFWDSARSFWRCLSSLAAPLLWISNSWLAFWIVDRHVCRSEASSCQELGGIFAKESWLLSWSLYRFFGAQRFRFPALSSPNKTAFGMRESSILATCPAQRSRCLRRMDSMLGNSAFSRTSSLDT